MKAEGTQQGTVAILLPAGANTNIRDVTIFANGPQATWGIRNASLAHVKVEGPTITTTTSGGADAYGISSRLNGSSVTVKRTVISVSGGTGMRVGISAFSVAALSEIRDVQINVTVGVQKSGDVFIEHSSVAGGELAVSAAGGGIGATRLNGSVIGPPCAGVYDESFTFYASTCP